MQKSGKALQSDLVALVLSSMRTTPMFTGGLERKVRDTLAKNDGSEKYFWTRAALELCHDDKNYEDCLETLSILHGFMVD